MVSGFKKSNNKKKEKFVLAKDPKQARIAIIVIVVFVINSIYTGIKIYQENNPPVVAQSEVAQTSPSPMGNPAAQGTTPPGADPMAAQQVAQNPAVAPDGSIPPGQPVAGTDPAAGQSPVTPQTPSPTPTPAPAPSGGAGVLIPIVLLALLGVGGYFAYKRFGKDIDKMFSSSGSKSAGGKPPKKGKFTLAKDPKQARIALIVIVVFVINSIYTGIKIYQENNPPVVASSEQSGQPMPPDGNPIDPALSGDPAMQAGQMPSPTGQAVDPNTVAQTPQANQSAPQDLAQDANDIYFQTISHKDKNNLNGPSQLPDNGIEIMAKNSKQKRFGKTVLISVDGTGNSNPFMPNDGSVSSAVPKALPYLTAPPETVSSNSDAGKVMETTISGILYDKYSPSAIIKIDGNDYLVKPGDIINRYKILQIGKTEVIVQLGRNIYKAGVGELLSLTSLNYNTIANLNKKFGGNHVQIKVKKKG